MVDEERGVDQPLAAPHKSVPADEPEELAWISELPAWRRPRPLWLYPLVFMFSLAMGMVMAPRMELMLSLICTELGLDDVDQRPGGIPTPLCRRSVPAQSRMAMLQLQLLTVAGVLSVLTTGFWSRLSDRIGRRHVLAGPVFGAFAIDVAAVVLSVAPMMGHLLRPQYLVLSSIIDGALGSSGTFTAMSQSYLTDVTTTGTRARLFALVTGSLFAGIAMGPAIGGALSKRSGTLALALLVGSGLHLLVLALLPMLPESLHADHRRNAASEHAAARTAAVPFSMAPRRLWRRTLSAMRAALWSPLHSLAFLLPQRRPESHLPSGPGPAELSHETPLLRERRQSSTKLDWNLLLLSVAYGAEMMCVAAVPMKIQYVQLVFGWNSSQVGYFLSYVAVTRMLALTLLVPMLVKALHHMPASLALPQDASHVPDARGFHALDADGHLTSGTAPSAWSDADTALERQWRERAKRMRIIHDSRMDMWIAVGSAALTAVAAVVTARASSAPVFLLGVFLTSMGAGIGSAISSLGMAVNPRTDGAGRLFGAWGVLSTLCGNILGPFLFATVFSYSAAAMPSMLYYVLAALQVVVIVSMLCVKLGSFSTLQGLPPRPRAPSTSS